MLRALALLVLLLALPVASAISYEMEAREDKQGVAYFALAGDDARNPPISAAPGDTLVIHFTNRGAARHNLHLGAPFDAGTPCCQGPNQSATLTVDVPANLTGDVAYQDALDPAVGGIVRIGPPIASLRILSPHAGESVARRVTMTVELAHFALGVDGRVRYTWDAGNKTLNATSENATHVFDGLGNGPHLLRAELVDARGQPLDPPAKDDVIVVVSAAATDDSTGVGGSSLTPTPSDSPSAAPSKTPGIPLLLGLATLALVALRRRR